MIKRKGYKTIQKVMSLIVPEREELNPDKDYFSTPRQHHAVLVILCTASKHYFFTMEIYISTPRKTSTLTIIFFTLLGFFLSSAIYSKVDVCEKRKSRERFPFNFFIFIDFQKSTQEKFIKLFVILRESFELI